MAQENGIAHFIDRYKELQVQRETSDTLIKVNKRPPT
jgi:hypothetical protein